MQEVRVGGTWQVMQVSMERERPGLSPWRVLERKSPARYGDDDSIDSKKLL